MTIIVWKKGILAADSQASSEYGCITSPVVKVHKFKDYLYGVSGSAAALRIIHDWVLSDRRISLPDNVGGKSYCALVIKKDIALIIENGGIQYVNIDEYHCIGSGAEIAYGALFMNASAVQAVEAAIAHSIYCGGTINTVTLGS